MKNASHIQNQTRGSPDRPAPRKGLWFASGIIVAAAFAAYCNSLNGPLVMDDLRALGENPSIRHLWPLGPLLSPPADSLLGSRPLANVSFALNYAAGGLQP